MFCRGCVFAPLSHKFWKWRSQNWPCWTSSAYWFWPGAGLWVRRSIPVPRITWDFTGIPVVVTVVLIGVLDFWTALVLQFSDNTYRLSVWKWVPANSRHSDGPMKIFWTCAAHSRCPTARNRKQQNYLRIFLFSLQKRNAKTRRPRKPMHIYQLSQCDYASLDYALNW